jgi:CBS domain-containing protein
MNTITTTPWIFEDQSLAAALDVIAISNERTVFVLSKDFKLSGVLTEGDAIRAYRRGQVTSTPAADVMTRSPVYFSSPVTDLDLGVLFMNTGTLLIPIVDESGTLVGSQSTRSAVERLITQEIR